MSDQIFSYGEKWKGFLMSEIPTEYLVFIGSRRKGTATPKAVAMARQELERRGESDKLPSPVKHVAIPGSGR